VTSAPVHLARAHVGRYFLQLLNHRECAPEFGSPRGRPAQRSKRLAVCVYHNARHNPHTQRSVHTLLDLSTLSIHCSAIFIALISDASQRENQRNKTHRGLVVFLRTLSHKGSHPQHDGCESCIVDSIRQRFCDGLVGSIELCWGCVFYFKLMS
jgi:hypothetical protein